MVDCGIWKRSTAEGALYVLGGVAWGGGAVSVQEGLSCKIGFFRFSTRIAKEMACSSLVLAES